MLEIFESGLVTLAALLPIVNPLGAAPIFLAMSADLPSHARQHLAGVVARNAFVLLAAAMLVGSYVLAFFGISLPVVRVAGGLVLLASGWRLLHARDERDAPPPTAVVDVWQREVVSIAIVAGTVYLSFRFASRLIAWPGETGTSVFLRLSAFILLCVAIAILWGGIVGLIESSGLRG